MDLDLLILGSGVAGLSAAVRAAGAGLSVGIVTKDSLSESATNWAQGGVAAVLAEGGDDSVAHHAADTIRAGVGLCDHSAVEVLVREGPVRVRELAGLGAQFDRDEAGRWRLSREGGHSRARVVHAGGAATGAEVERALVAASRVGGIHVWEHRQALDLIVEGGRARGVTTDDGPIRATETLLATGGAGHLYPVTTNPAQATGDGLAMALRAGVAVADLEFIQFHPTALYAAGAGPRPLLSEALRGEGALLLDSAHSRFVDELLPRDVVASAIAEKIAESGLGHVWLDIRPVEAFATRFPTLARSVRARGYDPAVDLVPVAPAAHYMCGGVLTDLDGATALPGLWAAGEVACTGVHGANRLASNSLLEGMVFAVRCVEAILQGKRAPGATGALRPLLEPGRPLEGAVAVIRLETDLKLGPEPGQSDEAKVRDTVQRAMNDGASVARSAPSLAAASAELDVLANQGAAAGEAANLLTVARAVLAAAAARTESRGGHRRRDFPGPPRATSHRFVQ